jgi:predicted enzyme related to lactoylglutathione lyase
MTQNGQGLVRGVDAVYYAVTDPARSATFYKGLLDIASVTWEGDMGAEYVLADGSAFGFGKLPGEWRSSGCVLFAVENVEAATARALELGATLAGELRELPVCRQQWCEDPDGNIFVLHQRTA